MNKTKTEDFEQKRRNRPIEITEIAIFKIRKTKIWGFSNAHEEFIQELHKLLLSEARKLNLENNTNKMEVGILIDIHSWDYWIIHGNKECEVEMKNNPEAYGIFVKARKNQLMFMHNHPSTGTFSGEDFKFFCNNDSLYIITVVGNDGTVYVLAKTADFDIRVLADYTMLAANYYKAGYIRNNGTLAIRDILKRANEYGLEYKKGSHR